LTMPLDAAQDAVARPCGPQVWGALLDELGGELAAVAPVATALQIPAGAAIADDGEPFIPRRGGRTPIRQDLASIARHGTDGSRIASATPPSLEPPVTSACGSPPPTSPPPTPPAAPVGDATQRPSARSSRRSDKPRWFRAPRSSSSACATSLCAPRNPPAPPP